VINQLLSSLGFNEDEVKTYLLLLETGPIVAGNLAKKTGVPRTSLYGFLKRLQERGLVVQSLKWNVKLFAAEPPEKISLIIEQRIEEFKRAHTELRTALPELHKLRPTKLIVPHFQLFEGCEGLQSVLKDMLLYSNMETQAFWPIKNMVEVLTPDFFRYFNKERIKSNLYTRAIWPQSQVVDVKKHPYLGTGEEFKRETRIAPKEVGFSMGYWVYGRKAAFLSSRKENMGFIIESAELVEMLKSQFEILWKLSKPLKTNREDTRIFLEDLKKNPYV